MEVFYKVRNLQHTISQLRREGKTIGFVPTMGALYEGHLSLIDCCQRDNDITVVSVFVNRVQFNRKKDYEKYPRDLEGDLEKLRQYESSLVFAPNEKEVYPQKDNRVFDFGHLDKVMEGKYRPGHFNGVARVVSRLFDIVRPDRAYFGEKDYQQLVIIRELTSRLNLDIEIVSCPLLREEDGLAISSRNQRLTREQRRHAAKISTLLFEAREHALNHSVQELKIWVTQELSKDPYIDVEYFEIMDERNLRPIQHWSDTFYKRAFVSAWVGEVRLIDNVKYYF